MTTLSPSVSSFQMKKLTDEREIPQFLGDARLYAAYALGQLELASSWNGELYSGDGLSKRALCLRFMLEHVSALFLWGSDAGVRAILKSMTLPKIAQITYQPYHEELVQEIYHLGERQTMLRLNVNRETFVPSTQGAVRLEPDHANAVIDLYRESSGGNFSSQYLKDGIYYGVWNRGKLVAMAGTHFLSQVHDLAAVGNVLTHRHYRNRGLATACTSAVTSELLQNYQDVILSVHLDNEAAKRVYYKLGYRQYCLFHEAWGYLRGTWGIGALFQQLWAKLTDS